MPESTPKKRGRKPKAQQELLPADQTGAESQALESEVAALEVPAEAPNGDEQAEQSLPQSGCNDAPQQSDQEPEIQPEPLDMNILRALPMATLRSMLLELPASLHHLHTRAAMVFALAKGALLRRQGAEIDGIVDLISAKNNAILRNPDNNFRDCQDDCYLPLELVKRYGLKNGLRVRARLRTPRPHDRSLPVADIISIEGRDPAEYDARCDFERLTPEFPRERLILETPEPELLATRIIDIIAPLGKGQRGLIIAPPRGGKTMLLKQIARSIRANHPEVELIVLLLDERPEEVTDFEESSHAQVFASTFDEPPTRQAKLANMVIDRAKRLVEQKKDVVILLDSLTRLSRGFNAMQSGGKIMSGGLGSQALEKPRKFFGAARNVSEGGSLTIVATCLVETESRMDEVIFEEFKGTGNMEIKLDRELAERRIFPAIHIQQSGTRNDDKLYHPQEFARVAEIRRYLSSLPISEALDELGKLIAKTQNNTELLLKGVR